MAQSTKCLTNGAVFHTHIQQTKVSVSIDTGFDLNIDEKEAELLEILIHNQLELVMRYYFEQHKNKTDKNCPTQTTTN